ncbi:MAG: Stk1 family PASTA domain-containing Ser/Thr kinase, partial [Lachnospiraceae bacterium]|nr:Stk1 family PASTA domain-containing Ser/Thr kinase [Lachnospiraceae bacterium]
MLNAGTFLAARYQILERIGQGGMADVYKAKDIKLGRLVAVKVLKNEFSSDETFVRKFNAEAQSAAGLSHPNIVNVYDVGNEGSVNYIVMELIQGITLKNFIKMKGRLETNEAVNIAIQIAQGLGAAHDARIIHRDIKPQNIILSTEGKAKITDFGIARMADSQTKTTNAAGSVHYISPEQARGGFSDERSDIYSLGITMYEMVTGKVPFEGETNVAVALSHIHDKMTPPRELVPGIPESLNKVILKCTDKKPDYRYQSAKELITDLRKVMSNPNGEYVLLGVSALAAGQTVVMTENEAAKVKAEASDQTVVLPKTEAERPRTDDTLPHREPAGPTGRDRDREYKPRTDRENVNRNDRDFSEARRKNGKRGGGGGVDPGLNKMMLVLAIIGIAVLAVILFFIITKASSCSSEQATPRESQTYTETEEQTESQTQTQQQTESETQSETAQKVEVPDFKKKEYEYARQLAGTYGLTLTAKDTFSDDIEEGYIVEQSVEPGEIVTKGSEIVVYVSKGVDPESMAEVTDVANYVYDMAKDKLLAAGFSTFNPVYEFSDDVEYGYVI